VFNDPATGPSHSVPNESASHICTIKFKQVNQNQQLHTDSALYWYFTTACICCIYPHIWKLPPPFSFKFSAKWLHMFSFVQK